jgi:hypothetical protein
MNRDDPVHASGPIPAIPTSSSSACIPNAKLHRSTFPGPPCAEATAHGALRDREPIRAHPSNKIWARHCGGTRIPPPAEVGVCFIGRPWHAMLKGTRARQGEPRTKSRPERGQRSWLEGLPCPLSAEGSAVLKLPGDRITPFGESLTATEPQALGVSAPASRNLALGTSNMGASRRTDHLFPLTSNLSTRPTTRQNLDVFHGFSRSFAMFEQAFGRHVR